MWVKLFLQPTYLLKKESLGEVEEAREKLIERLKSLDPITPVVECIQYLENHQWKNEADVIAFGEEYERIVGRD